MENNAVWQGAARQGRDRLGEARQGKDFYNIKTQSRFLENKMEILMTNLSMIETILGAKVIGLCFVLIVVVFYVIKRHFNLLVDNNRTVRELTAATMELSERVRYLTDRFDREVGLRKTDRRR